MPTQMGTCKAIVLGLGVLMSGCDEGVPAQRPADEDLPALQACDAVRDWNPELVELEREMQQVLDAYRADGAQCGSRGSFRPAPALRVRGALTCAARLHALDMASAGFFDHVGSDDANPWDRLRAVEYAFATADEVIAATDLPPQDILDELWAPREGSCAALSATSYVEVGIGVARPFDPDDPLQGRRWTVVLAKPIE